MEQLLIHNLPPQDFQPQNDSVGRSIDEVSIISNICFLHMHKRLSEIFGCSEY